MGPRISHLQHSSFFHFPGLQNHHKANRYLVKKPRPVEKLQNRKESFPPFLRGFIHPRWFFLGNFSCNCSTSSFQITAKSPHGSFAKIRPHVGRQGWAAAGQHRHHQRAGSRRYDLTSSLSLKTVSDMWRWGLRLVVYPIIYRVWDTSKRWLFGISEPSTISSR